PDVIHAPATATSYTPVNYVYALGQGTMYEYAYGSHYVSLIDHISLNNELEFNSYVDFDGGMIEITAEYDGELFAQPDVTVS
ncbi:MAG: hypothetical protein ACTSPB_13285, partial [Candidatus Thorarchaeota archaeon]